MIPQMSPPSMIGPSVARRSGSELMFSCRGPSIGKDFRPIAVGVDAHTWVWASTLLGMYQVGQWVLLSTQNLKLRLPCRKLSPQFIGPCRIECQINPVTYHLQLSTTYCISPSFHVSLLKPTPHLAPKAAVWNHCHQWKSTRPKRPAIVSRGLGRIWPGGTVLGQCPWYLGPFPNRRILSVTPRLTSSSPSS